MEVKISENSYAIISTLNFSEIFGRTIADFAYHWLRHASVMGWSKFTTLYRTTGRIYKGPPPLLKKFYSIILLFSRLGETIFLVFY